MERVATDAVTVAHAGYVDVTEDDRFQKLILIGPTSSIEDVATESAVHRMALALEEYCIVSYVMLHQPIFGYLNNNHGTTLQ